MLCGFPQSESFRVDVDRQIWVRNFGDVRQRDRFLREAAIGLEWDPPPRPLLLVRLGDAEILHVLHKFML